MATGTHEGIISPFLPSHLLQVHGRSMPFDNPGEVAPCPGRQKIKCPTCGSPRPEQRYLIPVGYKDYKKWCDNDSFHGSRDLDRLRAHGQ